MSPRRAVLAAAVALAPAGCDASPGPDVVEVAPAAARRGDAVAILGARFCGGSTMSDEIEEGRCARAPAGSVAFGLDLPIARAEVLSWRDARIEAVVPQAAAVGPSLVVVTVNGRASNGGDFEVLP